MAYEDWTTYTEDDTPGRLTVAANSITATNAHKAFETYRVYKDFGADHFGAEFEHDLTWTGSSYTNTPGIIVWAVSNTVDSYWNWANDTAVAVSLIRTDSLFGLIGHELGSLDSYVCTFASTYYPRVHRTSETAVECRIYSDAARTTLLDTLSVTVPTGSRFRYLFGQNCYNYPFNDATISCVTSNLNIHEVAAEEATTLAPFILTPLMYGAMGTVTLQMLMTAPLAVGAAAGGARPLVFGSLGDASPLTGRGLVA